MITKNIIIFYSIIIFCKIILLLKNNNIGNVSLAHAQLL